MPVGKASPVAMATFESLAEAAALLASETLLMAPFSAHTGKKRTQKRRLISRTLH